MELAPSGVFLTFEVTFDSPSLNVGMSVYDDTGVSPVLLVSPFAMLNVVGNTYRGKFAGDANKSYIIFKAVYTDDSFTTLSSDYSQGSESIIVQDIGGSSGGGAGGNLSLIGYVVDDSQIIGRVNC